MKEEFQSEEIRLTELIDVSILQQMQDSFSKMARMAAIITDTDGVAVTQPSVFSDFCANYCRKTPLGKARCEQCDRMGAQKSMEQNAPVSYKCHAGLVDFAAPIMLGDEMIGAFVGGQVLAQAPDEEHIRRVAKEIGVDEEAFVDAAGRIQVIPEAAITRATEFLFSFANVMSTIANNSYQMKMLNYEVMQAAVQKSDFLANMSHEIRTPMNAVLGMAEMALRGNMDADVREYIRQIQTSGKHLLVIINDILDFSKIDSGKMDIIQVVYNVEDMLEELSNLANSRIGDKPIEFLIDMPADFPRELYGDNIRIQQVLINLINNAIKFTQHGSVTLKLDYIDYGEDTVVFRADVIDTGNGIKKEDLPKLFESFQQVDSKRNRSVEGTGLGLAICKRLTEMMGGTISLESEYGVGTTFTIELPQRIQQRAEEIKLLDQPMKVGCFIQNEIVKKSILSHLKGINAEITDITKGEFVDLGEGAFYIFESGFGSDIIQQFALQHASAVVIVIAKYKEVELPKSPNIKVLKKPVYARNLYAALGICSEHKHAILSEDEMFSFVAPEAKVLVVDDNPINLQVAKGLLEPLQMQIDVANGAGECVDLANEKTYDIIFMDHMMPGVDGVETTHILRRMFVDTEATKIIALTANAVAGAKEMFLSEGMNDMVAKPIETKQMIAKVKQWLPKGKIIPVDMVEIREDKEAIGKEIADLTAKTDLRVQEAVDMLGSWKLYLDFLKQYYLDVDRKVEKIQQAMDAEDYQAYTIEVHSIKSASRQIGAIDVGAFASQLEKAGNTRNIAIIQVSTGEFIGEYLNLKLLLELTFPEWKQEQKQTEAVDIKASLDEMIEALNAYDSLLMDEVFEKIERAVLTDEKEQQLFVMLSEAQKEYDIDKCLEIIEMWKHFY